MTERLLQYIWQFQHFNKTSLTSVEGESLFITEQGLLNHNQGPDFLNAKILLDKTTWAGSIELHIHSSHWKDHKHSGDKNYNNVILHVVWHHDKDIGLPFSTLVLEDRVSKFLLKKYDDLMNNPGFIPCQENASLVNDIVWQSWKQRLLVERLQSKAQQIFDHLKQNHNHWEEAFWWAIARNFGIKVNSTAFESIARSLPLSLLAKHKNQVQQLEALLFGQAGLLETVFKEDYPILLQKEYRFLKKKYKLQKIHEPLHFLLMRPSNFPSLRLAQLAMLIHQSEHLFSKIKETVSLNEIRKLFELTANDYWHYHYVFDEETMYKKKNLGQQMSNNILINTVIPVIFAYGHYQQENEFTNRALNWLEQVKPENNSITLGFSRLGISNKTAFDSQALIQLKNEYCNKKRCLDCAVGNKLMKG